MFSEWYVRSWRYCSGIVRASNGLGQLGLAKSRPLRERFLRHSIGTPVLKSLWLFGSHIFAPFLKQQPATWLKDHSFIRCVVPKFSGRAAPVSRPFDQICALPPSTNSSMPVTKLESSEARNNAAFATSSGSPIRPMGMVETIRATTSGDCRLTSGVLIGPGLTTFERIRRSFRSVVQVRTKERIAALLAA